MPFQASRQKATAARVLRDRTLDGEDGRIGYWLQDGGELLLPPLPPDAATPIRITAAVPAAIQPHVPAEMPEDVFAPPDSPAAVAPSGFFGQVSHASEPAAGGAGGSAASTLETAPCPNVRKKAIAINAAHIFIGERNRRIVKANPL